MGRHADDTRTRGVAGWFIAVVVVVVLLAGGTVAYLLIVNRDTAASTGACTGSTVLPVVASTGAYPAMTEAAKDFDATAPVARSTCLTTSVRQFPGSLVANELVSSWTGEPAPPPTVWAADSLTDVTTLEADRSNLTAGRDDEPVATSPVVLAVRASDAVAVDGLSWANLPSAVGPTGSVQLPDGAHLTLALPDPETNRASAYALESVLAPDGSALSASAVSADDKQLAALTTGADTSAPDTATALKDLTAGGAAFNAVPVVESELAAFNATATDPLTAIYPTGPTAGDQIMAVTLTASWVDPTQSEAGAAFHAFLADPAGAAALVRGHVRVSGTTTPAVRGVTFTQPVTALPAAEPGVSAALAAAVKAGAPGTGTSTEPATTSTSPTPTSTRSSSTSTTTTTSDATSTPPSPTTSSPTTSTSKTTPTSTSPAPLTGPVVTLLQDTSATWTTDVDGRTRLQYAQQGLHSAVSELADGNAGLWSISSADGGDGFATEVATAPVRDAGQSGKLNQAIDGLVAGGSRNSYPAVVAAYQAASDGAVSGRVNKVVMITDGVDETSGYSREQVMANLTAIRDQGKGVQLIILGVGEAAPDDALSQLAAAGGGSYVDVPLSPDLPAAIAAAVR